MPQTDDEYAAICERIGADSWSASVAAWTINWLAARNIAPADMIDWGCGTGAAARTFAAHGWRVTGIDVSDAMLALARKHTLPDRSVEWRKGDLRQPVDVQPATLATAFYDTLNDLADPADFRAAWRTIAATLVPGGYAIVDLQTPYAYATEWRGQPVMMADTDDVLALNRLRYNARSGLARRHIVWFAREADDHWRRGAETHVQRAHTDDEVAAAIVEAGLTLVERQTPQGAAPTATATRLIYVAQKL